MVLEVYHADHNIGSGIYLQKEEVVKKGIAFFDFDGTITTKDTLLEFIKFSKGKRSFMTGFLLNSPYLFAYKAKLISNQLAKEKVLAHFFGGMKVSEFKRQCRQFHDEVLPGLIRKGAIKEIADLKAQGFVVVIVSASPECWIADWAKAQGAELIASRLKEADGILTGEIEGKNCYGEEKVNRIKEKYRIDEFDPIYAYGDTSGDLPMLALASKQHYRPFRD